MRDIVELDENDIIRVLAMEIAREKGWATTGHTGVVTLTVRPVIPDASQNLGRSSGWVSARVEKVSQAIASNGKILPITDSR